MMQHIAILTLLLISQCIGAAFGFTAPRSTTTGTLKQSSAGSTIANNVRTLVPTIEETSYTHTLSTSHHNTALYASDSSSPNHYRESTSGDASELIARRIVVTGDVNGGYYRSCVKNEGSRFRKLVGSMTDPDDSERAEIYVEGKRKMVEGFIRWCKNGDVGLSQTIKVESVSDEDPMGLYDDFYVHTGR